MRKLTIEEIERVDRATFQAMPKRSLVAVLDNIRSRGNVGTILRTADAFALEAVYLCGYTPRPPHPDIRKSALDAELSVTWHGRDTTLEALDELAAKGYSLLALEHTDDASPLEAYTLPDASGVALVLGNEVFGVQQAVLDRCTAALEIPQYGTKHSLNVAVAAGVALYRLSLRLAVRG